MKSWFPSVLETGFYALCFALAAWMFIPGGGDDIAGAAISIKPTQALREQRKEGQGADMHPEKLAELFGWKRQYQPAKPSPAEVKPGAQQAVKEPVAAAWVVFVGVIKENDGESIHYFKDTKNGKVLKASRAQGQQEWQIVEETSSDFVLKNSDILMKVRKR